MSTSAVPSSHAADRHARAVQDILASVDVQLGGARPWDIHVRDVRFFARVLRDGALGLGESYMESWWETERLDELFVRLGNLDARTVPVPLSAKWLYVRGRLFNAQKKARAFRNAGQHYNLGNDLFQAMLDPRMTYSCGYWRDASTLAAAQEAKLELVCRKLRLRPGHTLLDVGCGWASLVKYAAEKYGVHAVGITVSNEQARRARELCAGLPVEILVQDYRDVSGSFDRVVSIGMFEHVGSRNHRTFFDVVRRCLRPDGLLLLHTIGSNRKGRPIDAWTAKYIFPDGELPSIGQIGVAIEGRFVMEDWHNFGADYDPTLMAWFTNFDAAWAELRPRYGDGFYRMWKYYLLSCAGSFRARRNNVWQIVLSQRGMRGGYHRP